jgi:hypothetical protein
LVKLREIKKISQSVAVGFYKKYILNLKYWSWKMKIVSELLRIQLFLYSNKYNYEVHVMEVSLNKA